MKINIWSDIACPFCYIGLKKLQVALDKFAHKDEVELVWHSYELNPELPLKMASIPYEKYMIEGREVSKEEVQADMKNLHKLGDEVGIKFNFDKLVVANTSLALSLVKFATQYKLDTQAEEALFEAYFTQGKDVSNTDCLLEIARKIGLNESEVKEFFKNNTFLEEVEDDTLYGDEELELEYIPYYLFNNNQIIQGSVSVEDYTKTLEKSFEDWKANGESQNRGETISGQSCSIDGVCS